MKEITEILRMSDKELMRHLRTQVGRDIITDNNNYIYRKGNIPLCFVAHIDTVSKNKIEIEIKRNVITNKHGILGADDRAGVYALLQILRVSHPDKTPHILFTNYEESGGIGVKQFCKDIKEMPNINLFVELDRCNANDYVYYIDIPQEVKDYIESFGFVEDYGSYSDIYDLTKTFRIPSVNISVGYYHQHTVREFLVLDILDNTIDRCLAMCDDYLDTLYEVEEVSQYSKWRKYYMYDAFYMSKEEAEYNLSEKYKKELDDYECEIYRGYSYYDDYFTIFDDFEDVMTEVEEYLEKEGLIMHSSCVNCGANWFDCKCEMSNQIFESVFIEMVDTIEIFGYTEILEDGVLLSMINDEYGESEFYKYIKSLLY